MATNHSLSTNHTTLIPTTTHPNRTHDINLIHEPPNDPPVDDPQWTYGPIRWGHSGFCEPGDDGGDPMPLHDPACYIYKWIPHIDVIRGDGKVTWKCTCMKEGPPQPTALPSLLPRRGLFAVRDDNQKDPKHDYVQVIIIVLTIFFVTGLVLGVHGYRRRKRQREMGGGQHRNCC